MKVYGIPNCNTVKKALDWLKLNKIEFEFHDFKKLGISESKLEQWAAKAGWEALLNKRGTTWRMLDPELQNTIITKQSAFKLMQEKPSIIKRPVIETEKELFMGFDENAYLNIFKQA